MTCWLMHQLLFQILNIMPQISLDKLILRCLMGYCNIMLENPLSTDVGASLKDILKTIDLEISSSHYNSIETIVQSKRIKKGH